MFVAGGAVIVGDVTIGDRASVWFNSVIRGDVCPISVGDETNIQDGTVIHVTTGRFATRIGRRVTVGHAAMLHGCTIEDGALVGMRATVLDGAVVESGAMVAAGALVAPGKVVPAGHLALGAPARIVRPLREGEVRQLAASAEKYVALAQRYLVAGEE